MFESVCLQFSNSYWSADYKSGIDRLCEQSLRSVQQTHELRQLVFNYMNYFHSNSEYLTKLTIDSLPLESTFRPYTRSTNSDVSLLGSPGRARSNNAFKRFSDSFRSVSSNEHNLAEILEKPEHTESSLVSIGSTFELYVRSLAAESKTLMKLAGVIDREVLEKISAFIKVNEPQVRKIVDSYHELFSNYESTYKEVEKLKSQYDELVRLQEISETEPPRHEQKDENSNDDSFNSSYDRSVDELTDVVEQASPSPEELDFKFPLHIGSVKVSNASDLSSIIKKLITSIPTVRRKIPIPGYKNEIFSSDLLCDYITKYRPFPIEPTRVNLEKFGQSLLDHKLLVGTGFLGANKFKSEGLWYEWSDLAVFTSQYQQSQSDLQVPSESTGSTSQPQTPKKAPKIVIDESTAKFMNETSKRFNGMFKSVRSSLMKSNYAEQLVEVENDYNESYEELQRLKHLLDLEILQNSQVLEKFERTKIELIYQSLAKLLEIVYNFSLTSTNALHKLAIEFIEKVNKPDNYQNDFDKLIEDFTTGIYFPSIVSPNNLTKRHFSTNQSNNNFQNLRRQFNLYKDIQLHLQLSNLDDDKSQLLTIASIPQFLYNLVKLIEESTEGDVSNISSAWSSPLDHQNYWTVKEQVIGAINQYEPASDIDTSQEQVVHKDILDKVLVSLKPLSTFKLVNFLKNWLLEISDSLIPCLVYDSVISLYKLPNQNEGENKNSRVNELTRIIGSVPRSNLASLIFMLEHIGAAFKLGVIESYETADDLPITSLDEVDLKDAVTLLNQMEAIGAIPFIHLIFRPSAVKNSSGFKPPLEIYGELLGDLLSLEVRTKLLKTLINNEKNYKTKRDNEKFGLQKKLPSIPPPTISTEPPTTPSKNPTRTIISGSVPKSPRPLSGDNFALRPFRTRATPNPSPSTSPRHTPQSSVDLNGTGDNRIRKRDSIPLPRESSSGRPRSTSNSLTPSIDVEFE
ncbi:uncharacterized protein CANTADRAFT_3951 [Suhomyces tanzawaensis NRRL Y-17324]|uniref:Rho-GAP domain-containing protein n=1 Tax=Suhomyces tanzawaensis NRRL Y-17324 TaxID=984487 RepID=A0A1E4SQV2_9ASCO|nr:uncharacterized protein CANTADRAFT_3951 [Suhomyces tanzawaensis NRRL Y-17324]ODV81893.1 hypothetical protein CANTADRAFT_3951 [Suhomyces tanzawaensis NRRL Y-17324]